MAVPRGEKNGVGVLNSPNGKHAAGCARSLRGDVEGAYEKIVAVISKARESSGPLNIVGGGTKAFYGRPAVGVPLETGGYSGIAEYEPAELVITVRAGTSLQSVEQTLAAENQMLAFEPPSFGAECTIGGMVAAGLSGPRRPYGGAVRDAMLGVTIMTGSAEPLNFGGQVMKNVAGYDVSRLMTGAMGTLGLLLAVSLRVAPRPQSESTLVWAGTAGVRERMIDIARRPWPVSAMSFDGEFLRVRLSGHTGAVREAQLALAPDTTVSNTYWRELKDQTLPFFQSNEPLWRLVVLPAATPLQLEGDWLWDWGGACRWLKSGEPAARIRTAAQAAGGHATLFRADGDDAPFTELDRVKLRVHRRLKKALDPQGIFNPGRLYTDL